MPEGSHKFDKRGSRFVFMVARGTLSSAKKWLATISTQNVSADVSQKNKNLGKLPCKDDGDDRRLVKGGKLSSLYSLRYPGWETNGFAQTDIEDISLIYRFSQG